MGFIKMLIGVPLLMVILVFAFVNNDLATFNLWPFYIEITVSLSVAIVFFILLGFILGEFFSWLSYSPVRKALRSQKKENKKLNKEQQKLVKEMDPWAFTMGSALFTKNFVKDGSFRDNLVHVVEFLKTL